MTILEMLIITKRSLVKRLKIYELSTTVLLSEKISDYVNEYLKGRKIINVRVAKGRRDIGHFFHH